MENTFDTRLECIDWRYSAAIVGLIKYFKFQDETYDSIKFKPDLSDYNNSEIDYIEYNREDIFEDRFLHFAEHEFIDDMYHTMIEDILSLEEFSDEQIKLVNEKLKGNVIMKKIFGKVKFDGKNKQEILKMIDENRSDIVRETFRNKKNMYSNYCNTNLLFKEEQPHCRLQGYNIDEGRKSKAIGYTFNKNAFVSSDMLEFDFIPFAFSNTYEALFINNSSNINNIWKSYCELKSILSTGDEKDARTKLFRGIIESAEFVNYDVEVITKNRDNDYFETLYIRKKAVDILKNIGNSYKAVSFNYKINDNYYINIQKEVVNCILNDLLVDKYIELLLKDEKNYSYIVSNLVKINQKIRGVEEQMTTRMKQAYACAREVVKKIDKNKVKSYRQKLISSIIAEDYNRACDIMLQLSAYSDVSFGFAYDLYEDFEENKDIAYTFVNALEEEKNYDAKKDENN